MKHTFDMSFPEGNSIYGILKLARFDNNIYSIKASDDIIQMDKIQHGFKQASDGKVKVINDLQQSQVHAAHITQIAGEICMPNRHVSHTVYTDIHHTSHR